MTYSIVFSSVTGNTAALADRLRSLLPDEDCLYFGHPTQEAIDVGADLVFVGFRTENEMCDDRTKLFLKRLDGKTIVLFGTAPTADPKQHERIMNAVVKEVPVSNTTIPGLMCLAGDVVDYQRLDGWVEAFNRM